MKLSFFGRRTFFHWWPTLIIHPSWKVNCAGSFCDSQKQFRAGGQSRREIMIVRQKWGPHGRNFAIIHRTLSSTTFCTAVGRARTLSHKRAEKSISYAVLFPAESQVLRRDSPENNSHIYRKEAAAALNKPDALFGSKWGLLLLSAWSADLFLIL